MSRVLVVEDEAHLAQGLRFNLQAEGHAVEVAGDGETALDRLVEKKERFDAVVLDVMLPGKSGFDVAALLREKKNYVPILMLTARGRPEDVLQGFAAGADDYLPKPCNPRELLARVRAVLRRHRATRAAVVDRGDVYEFTGWRLDVTRRNLRDPSGIYIDLSDGEFSLLRSFVEHPQRVLSRDHLLELVRGRNTEVYDRAIDSQISRLRRKLNNRTDQELIRTVRNEGYMLVPKVARL